MTAESRPAPVNNADDDQAKIQTYEEAFRRIKEATGVSDTQARAVCCLVIEFVFNCAMCCMVALIVSLFTARQHSYAKRCTSYRILSDRLSDRLSVCLSQPVLCQNDSS